jgi:hypothetical protein
MATARRRVILYGDSVILTGVRASLERRSDLEVLAFDRPVDWSLEELGAHCPAGVIFDLAVIEPDLLLSLLQQPGLLLIGINPETHQVMVWSGREAAVVVAADLVDVILRATQGVPLPG